MKRIINPILTGAFLFWLVMTPFVLSGSTVPGCVLALAIPALLLAFLWERGGRIQKTAGR